jgi:hypothetical protein
VTTTRDVSSAASSTKIIGGWAEWLARRQLALPALLFLEAHAPLRFLAGQTCAVAAPLAGLLGLDAVQTWADVLSDAEAFADLRRAVDAADRQQTS